MDERRTGQSSLFYGFSLERHVPQSTCFAPSTGSSNCLSYVLT